MGTEEFRAYLERALFLDREDPVAAWQELSRFQEGLIRRLSAAKELRILAPGTDLRLSVAGRTWVNSDGRRNMPSGEVFTGPVEDSAEGEVRFNLPAFVGGRRVERCTSALPGARWWRPGRRRGGLPPSGPGHGRGGPAAWRGGHWHQLRPGPAHGPRPPGREDGGTVHLALGRSYPEAGGRNESALHWDLVLSLREGRLLLDGTPLLEAGRFL